MNQNIDNMIAGTLIGGSSLFMYSVLPTDIKYIFLMMSGFGFYLACRGLIDENKKS